MSDLMEIHGKPGKLRFNDDGISVFYRKEALVIPDKVLGKKLGKKEKEQLLAGDIVPITVNKKDILLQVDRDLNSVILRTNQEIKIPDIIGQTSEYGGYKLTKADKYLLANGHALENKLLHSPEGYFIADIQLTDDRKGVMIQNIQSITPGKAQELIKAMTPKLEAHAANIEAAKEQKHEEGRNMEAEFKEAVGKHDFEKSGSSKRKDINPVKSLSKESVRNTVWMKGKPMKSSSCSAPSRKNRANMKGRPHVCWMPHRPTTFMSSKRYRKKGTGSLKKTLPGCVKRVCKPTH